MRRWLKYIGYFLLFLFTLFIGVMIYLFSTDFSGWKDNIADYMSEELGKEVVIEEFTMDLGSDVSVNLSGVTISDAGNSGAGNSGANIGKTPLQSLSLDRLVFRASLPSLIFSDHALIHQFHVENLIADVKLPASQKESSGDRQKGRGQDFGGGGFDGGGYFPIIKDLDIRNIQLRLFEGDNPTPTMLSLEEASIRAENEASPHILLIKGDADGWPIDVKGQFGSVNSLFDDNERFDMSLSGILAMVNLSLEGGIMDPLAMRDVDLRFHLSGGELTDFVSLFGAKDFTKLGSWRINGHIIGEDRDDVKIDDLDIQLGAKANTHFHAKGMVANAGKGGNLDLTLDILLQANTMQDLLNLAKSYNPDLANMPMIHEDIIAQLHLKGGMTSLAARDIVFSYGGANHPFIEIKGRVGNLYPTNDLALNLAVNVPNAGALRPTLQGLGQENIYYQIANMPPLRFDAKIEAGPIEQISIQDIKGQFGKSDLSGMMDIAFNRKDEAITITSRLNSKMINIREMTALDIDAPATSEKGNDKTSRESSKDIDGDIDDLIEPFTVDVNYGIDVLDIYGIPLNDVSLAFTIKDGKISLQALPISLGGGNLALLLKGDAKKDPIKFDFDFDITGVNPGLIPANISMPLGGALNLSSNISFEGLDKETILSSLDGTMDMDLKNSDLSQMSFGGFSMSSLNKGGFKGMDLVKIGCLNLPIRIDDGVFKTNDGFVGGTHLLTMIDGGYDALKDELDIHIAPDVNDLQIPISVKGSASDPDISVTKGAGAALMTMLFGADEDLNWAQKVDAIRRDLPANHGCQSYLSTRRDDPPPLPQGGGNSPLDKLNEQIDERLGDDADAIKGILKGLF